MKLGPTSKKVRSRAGRTTNLILTGIVFTSLTAQANPAANPKDVTATRSIMTQIFTSLTDVLPVSLDPKAFSSPENRERILANLAKLKQESGTLATHTKAFEGSYGFIADSMARDLREIHTRFEKGNFSEARYLLGQVTENCANCHVKLPDPDHAPKLDHFFKDVSIAKLEAPERARLQIALRQFDEALKTWESMFSSWTKPREIFAMDALTEYLKVCIRVKGDLPRANNTLSDLSKRASLPRFMQREVKAWQKSLTRLTPEFKKSGDELSRAHKIILNAQNNMEYPLDRTAFVDFAVASGILNRFLADGKGTKDQQSHANYLLGQTESLIGRGTWLSQIDFYYETAIRLAPQSKHALLAYDALEQQILLEYSGSGGTHIPEDLNQTLDELRTLIQKGRPAK